MKQILVLVTVVAALLLSGCGSQQISRQEAEDIALSHAGLSRDQVTFVDGEKESDDGKTVYDVEFYTKDSREFDYEIDAKTGNVLSYDSDVENYTPSANTQKPAQPANEPAVEITKEQAIATALEKVPGATEENIREFALDRDDDDRMEYEGKIIYNNREYNFKIDATTGEFISWEEDSVGD